MHKNLIKGEIILRPKCVATTIACHSLLNGRALFSNSHICLKKKNPKIIDNLALQYHEISNVFIETQNKIKQQVIVRYKGYTPHLNKHYNEFFLLNRIQRKIYIKKWKTKYYNINGVVMLWGRP